MLTRLNVRGFKSIKDVTVALSPLVVLFGPNTAGKSNFLESILLLARLASERTLADAFSYPLRGYTNEAFTFPDSGLSGLLAMPFAEVGLSAYVSIKNSSYKQLNSLQYEIEVRVRPETGELRVESEFLARLGKHGQLLQTPKPRIEKTEDHLVVRRLQEVGQPRQEPIGLNHTQVSNRQFSGEKYPDFDALRDEMSAWRTYYLDPRVSMRAEQAPREVTDIGSDGAWIAPFLFRLKKSSDFPRQFNAVVRAVKSAIPTIDNVDVDLDERRGTLDIEVTQHGTPFSSRVISEGTLRVLALCAIAANPWPNTLIAFEEPENGVHPRRIEVIASLLDSMANEGKRQVIVTTHSPTLVSAMIERQAMTPDRITLLRCYRDESSTRIEPFRPSGPLFDKTDVTEALRSLDDQSVVVEQMLRRGWLDG